MTSVLGDRAVLDDERAVADFGQILIVSDDDERDAVLAGEIEQDGHDFRAVVGVEVARRLVGEEDFRLVDDRAGDGDALLLATGKLGGKVVGAIAETDTLERFDRKCSRISTRNSTGDGDVFQGG